MEQTIQKITQELNDIFHKIKDYWNDSSSPPSSENDNNNEEETNKRRKRLLWITIVGIGGVTGVSVATLLWWYLVKKNNRKINSNQKSKSNYIPDVISTTIEKTRENIWIENLDPYLNDTHSYYQYLVKSKQMNKHDGIRFDPQWRISPSYTVAADALTKKKKKKNSTNTTPKSNGFVQYRTQSLVGREAGLPRIFSSEEGDDGGLVVRFMSQSNSTNSGSSGNGWIYYMEQIRYIISLLFYRLPRAVAEWELWIGACSAALYFVAMNPPFGGGSKRNGKDKSKKTNSIFMDGVMHRVVEESNGELSTTNNVLNSKVVKLIGEGSNVEVLEKNFDEIINPKERDIDQ